MSSRAHRSPDTHMPSFRCSLLLACVALASGGCGQRATGAAAAPVTTSQTAPAAASAPDAAAASGMAHGDHNAHHGGVVYMYDDMHYEVVLAADGRHRLYFSDAVREDLPASVAASVTLTVERPKTDAEALKGVIDENGESWVLTGRPIADSATSVRVAFVVKGSEYWIDVPFIQATQ